VKKISTKKVKWWRKCTQKMPKSTTSVEKERLQYNRPTAEKSTTKDIRQSKRQVTTRVHAERQRVKTQSKKDKRV